LPGPHAHIYPHPHGSLNGLDAVARQFDKRDVIVHSAAVDIATPSKNRNLYGQCLLPTAFCRASPTR